MTDRPIIFSGPMIRALLSGQKTQTRRVVKPPRGATGRYPFCIPQPDTDVAAVWWHDGDPDGGATLQQCPYGQIGDRLWVREAWALVPATAYRHSDGVQQVLNPNDPDFVAIFAAGWDRSIPKWRSPIHMPRWAARLTLRITEVRVEQLQDISSADAKAEGAEPIHLQPGGPEGNPSEGRISYVEGYRAVWESINGEGSWNANPWVWALTFEVEQ